MMRVRLVAAVVLGLSSLVLVRVPPAAAAGATFAVNTTADHDDGTCAPLAQLTDCTLREAINAANAATTTDTISFSIPGAGVQSIAPTSSLPIVTGPATIDGSTQPGYAGSPLIELNGTSAGASADGLWLNGGSSTVRALVINRFGRNGIVLAGGGSDVVVGNRIGTNAAGAVDLGNGATGVLVNFVNDNTVGGATLADRNVLSGNEATGVDVRGGQGNLIAGNRIGTDLSGAVALGNTSSGVYLEGPSNTVGGTAGDGNVISGNGLDGVRVDQPSNSIAGNTIGTNADGTGALANGNHGVYIARGTGNIVGGTGAGAGNLISGNVFNGVQLTSASNTVLGNRIGTNAAGSAALANSTGVAVQDSSGNTIGGAAPGAGNLLSGNRTQGVTIVGASAPAANNVVMGNRIGTDAAGLVSLANPSGGILVQNSSANTIGGSADGAGNLLSGAGAIGVRLAGATSTQNTVAGNQIGIKADRSGGLGGLIGVLIDLGANHNLVGGTDQGAGNLIAYQSRDGIQLQSGTSNAIRQNVVFSNGRLAVDLNAAPTSNLTGDGVTQNDPGDADVGANDLQNYPVVAATVTGSTATVTGTLTSHASTEYSVDLYFAGACDPSGHGEADAFISSTTVLTDSTGRGVFSVPVGLLENGVVTATATDPAGNTSELSACGPINHAPAADAGTDLAAQSDTAFDLDGSGSSDPDGQPLTYLWEQVEGPAATIEDPTAEQTQVAGVRGPATLRFRLTVTDANGASATDEVVVTVAPK